jgi:transposase-like protein
MRENLRCPECLSDQLVKVGFTPSGGKLKQDWRCKSCGRHTVRPIDLSKLDIKPLVGGRLASG